MAPRFTIDIAATAARLRQAALHLEALDAHAATQEIEVALHAITALTDQRDTKPGNALLYATQDGYDMAYPSPLPTGLHAKIPVEGDPLAYVWALFPGRLTKDEAFEKFSELDRNPFGYYGGPGRAFADEAWVRSTNTRTLVVQRCGLDV